MSPSYAVQELVTQSESLLEGLDELAALGEAPAEGDSPELQGQIRKNGLEFITSGVDLQLDGYFELEIEPDDRRAIANLYPPSGDRDPLRIESVMEALAERGIVAGVQVEDIQRAVFQCNTERVPVEGVVVARAIEPVAQKSEHLAIEESLVSLPQPRIGENERVDFRAQSAFVLVTKGQLLARRVPAVAGIPGKTITGSLLPFGHAQIRSPEPGRNTSLEQRGLVATCDGRLSLNEHTISVSAVLDITGDVGYGTGHVNFPGDVIIHGEVEQGFNVTAGGKLYCLQTLDASEVACENDLIVRRGIVGRGSGSVRSGGTIQTRFIEHCHVEAAADVSVEVGVMNSNVNTTGRLQLGHQGVVVGGRVNALLGVLAFQVGTASGPRTEIHCGTDFRIEQKLVVIRDRNIELAMKLKNVEERLQRCRQGSQEAAELDSLRGRMKEAIHALNEAASQLVFQLHKSEDADVIVVGKVFPGTYVEICHMPYVVDRTLKRVRFHLDKDEGKVLVEPLRVNPYASEGN